MKIVAASQGPSLKIYPELSRAAVAAGHTTPARIWYLLRYLDRAGRGTVSRGDLRDLLLKLGLNWRALETARSHQASGIYFTDHADAGYIEYRSVFQVATALRTRAGSRTMLIGIHAAATVATFRAALYGAWLGQRGHGLNMSRAGLCALWGVTVNTLKAWERLAGISVTQQITHVREDDADRADRLIPTDTRDAKLGQRYTFRKKGYDGFFFQTVNQYTAPSAERGRRGNTRRINSFVKPVLDVADGMTQKVFFADAATGSDQLTPGACLWGTAEKIVTRKFDRGSAGELRQAWAGPAALWRLEFMRPTGTRRVLD